MKPPLQRLTNHDYFHPGSAVRVFRQTLNFDVHVHWHEFYELTYVIRGCGVHRLNERNHFLRPGSMFLLTPVDIHEIIPEKGDDFHVYNIIFSDAFFDDELYQLLFPTYAPMRSGSQLDLYGGTAQWFEREFEMLVEEGEGTREDARRMASATLQRILIQFARVYEQRSASSERPIQLQRIAPSIRYIHHHFRDSISLAAAAGRAGLAPNYFSQRFREIMGVSFQHYIQHLRIQFALALLRNSSVPVIEICYASGFQTLSHFNRVFRQSTGMSPRNYRSNEQQRTHSLPIQTL